MKKSFMAFGIVFSAALTVTAVSNPLKASLGGTVITSTPIMTGAADAPKTVDSGAMLLYPITQADLDTYKDSAQPQHTYAALDPSCRVSPIVVRSMTRYKLMRRGASESTVTYDITGKTVPITGTDRAVCLDSWFIFNKTRPGSLNKDQGFDVTQTVIVRSAPGKVVTTSDSETAKSNEWQKDLTRNALEDRTKREQASDKLRSALLKTLSGEQRRKIKNNDEVEVPVAELSSDLREQALEYIKVSGGVMENPVTIAGQPAVTKSFTLVFLPKANAPTGTLGVNVTHSGGGEVRF